MYTPIKSSVDERQPPMVILCADEYIYIHEISFDRQYNMHTKFGIM